MTSSFLISPPRRSRTTWLRRFLSHPPVLWPLLFLVLTALWLPGLGWPVVSDTAIYALLGESLWQHGTYVFDGLPYAKQLPFHAFLSYPLTLLWGPSIGMKVSTLLAGFAVLLGTFVLFRKSFSSGIALLAALFVLFHHGFVLMTILGSADLLFTALFLFSLAAFDRAEKDTRWYLVAGLLLGLSVVTRYNSLVLFPLYPLYLLWKRRSHFRSGHFWCGMLVACAFFGGWLVRNALTFGNPLHSEYGPEYAGHVASFISEFFRNVLYYVNPLHNILPVLLVLALWGLKLEGRKHALLVLGLAAGCAFGMLWWTKGIRFVFPAYPILLGFAAIGTVDVWRRWRRWRWVAVGVLLLTAALHASVLCVYAYGQCNAWVDAHVGILPAHIGLSSEGLYSLHLAKEYINEHAPDGAAVLVLGNDATWKRGFFRKDLRVVASLDVACPAYEMVQGKPEKGPLFVTDALPQTVVVLRSCP